MNQHNGIDNPPGEWLSAAAAAEFLDVKKPTLYAYASRGLIRSVPIAGTRGRNYAKPDLERLRARKDARRGHRAVAAGALRWGEPVLDSAITEIHSTGHAYRGKRALDLVAEGATYEDVCELIWSDAGPAAATPWPAVRLGISATRLRATLPEDARPIDALAVAIPVLGAADPLRFDPSPPLQLACARRLVRRAIACLGLVHSTSAVRSSLEAGSTARALGVALGGRTGPAAVRAIEHAMILLADHELNPSSFAARVPASVGADLYASVSAAVAAVSGPAHGAACERIDAMLDEAERPEQAVSVIKNRLRRGDLVPGFGHPLYPDGDPRAEPLLSRAEALAPRSRRVRTARAFSDAMALAGGEPATVDLGLVALSAALRLPRGGGVALFASGRMAGWIAHAREQAEAGFALRPRARYVGVVRT